MTGLEIEPGTKSATNSLCYDKAGRLLQTVTILQLSGDQKYHRADNKYLYFLPAHTIHQFSVQCYALSVRSDSLNRTYRLLS